MHKAPRNSRFFIVATTHVQLLIGVFYAPHAGNKVDVLLRFDQLLWKAWTTIRQIFPTFWGILVGDVSIPALFQDDDQGVRSIAPKGQTAR